MLRLKKTRKIKDSYAALRDIGTNYTATTTIHGLRYLTDKRYSTAERVFWLIILFMSVIFCGYFIFDIIEKWNSSPVVMTFESRTTQMLEIPLPAVTLCPNINIRYDRMNISKIREALKNGNLSGLNLDADQLFILKEMLFRLCTYEKSLWWTIDVPKRDFIDVDIMLLLAMVALPMNEIILGCNLGDGWERNCYQNFQMVFTGFGVCYTWNALSPAEFYRDNVVYTTEFGNTNFTKPSTWSLENGYADTLDSKYPHNTIGGQSGKTVTFLLNNQADDIKFGCNNGGFEVFIHSPSDMTMRLLDPIAISLTTDVRISVTPKMIVTSDELWNYAPSVRNCYYEAERNLSIYKVYSENNCMIECINNHTLRGCNCIFFLLPRIKGTRICSLDQLECLDQVFSLYGEESRPESGEGVCDCKPACTSLMFDLDLQHSPTDSIHSIYEELRINSTESYTSSVVSVLYKESEFIPLIRSELFSKTDLIANCGGTLGLFLGISLISFVEFFFFCVIRPFFYLRKK